jgi:glycosyltransferase involved in cell wall biosynthesis
MPRDIHIGYWCPALLGQTGIADYGAMLADALARRVPLTHVIRRDWEPFAISGVDSLTDVQALVPGRVGPTVHLYHLGNAARHHAHMLPALLRTGGIVVLHDLSLFDLFHQMFRWQPDLWAQELRAQGYQLDEPISPESIKRYRHTMRFLGPVIRAADVIVVHTQWAAASLRDHFPTARVVVVPLAAKSVPYLAPPREPVVAILGGLAPHKGLSVALQALPAVREAFPNLKVRIVGRNDDLDVLRNAQKAIAEWGLTDCVTVRTDMTDELDFAEEFRRASVVVTLRTESIGEMSGIMPRAWGAGRVVVTSDQPQFREFSSDMCWRVPVGEGASAGVTAALCTLLGDQVELERRSAAAWSFGQSIDFDEVAQRYVALARDLATTQPRDDVNVVGSWGATTGLAQRSRHLVEALSQRVRITTPYGYTVQRHHAELVPSVVAFAEKRARSPITLWTSNVNEMPIVLPSISASPTAPYNIGLWTYEFPELPPHMLPTLRRVDEVWSDSAFAADIFRRAGAPEVRVIPDIVELRTPTRDVQAVRAELGIAPEQTMFYFSFDYRSGWGRKNPDGAVRAFRDAALGSDAVLVVKSTYLPDSFAQQLREIAGDARVQFINGFVSNEALTDLFCAADVYLSLHRSEGFGLGMAEAMRIGKLVIGTNYSGNIDYMHEDNALLVDWSPGRLGRAAIEANPGLHTVIRPGSPWAEPSHESAVAAIRRATDPALRQQLGARAAIDLARTHSAEAVGTLAAERIRTLLRDLEG